ncbi:hypothetical protein Z946_74 [Sulfitobacter noctilucicola]|nr:hypothetical protein Z946_74 [Sulfitobacter noctilucicola]
MNFISTGYVKASDLPACQQVFRMISRNDVPFCGIGLFKFPA